MALNKNMGTNIMRGIDRTHNMITGKCPNDCIYCFDTNRCYSGKPKEGPLRIIEKAMLEEFGDAKVVWMMSTTEPGWVKFEDLVRIMARASKFPHIIWHMVLKHPRGILNAVRRGLKLPKNMILALTLESDKFYPAVYRGPAQSPESRIADFNELIALTGCKCYVMIDPAMKFDPVALAKMVLSCNPYMVYYGEDTSGQGLPTPTMEEAEALFVLLRPHTKVMMLKTFERKYLKWKAKQK